MSLTFDLENLCFLRDTSLCGWEVGSFGGGRQELWPQCLCLHPPKAQELRGSLASVWLPSPQVWGGWIVGVWTDSGS